MKKEEKYTDDQVDVIFSKQGGPLKKVYTSIDNYLEKQDPSLQSFIKTMIGLAVVATITKLFLLFIEFLNF